MVIITVYSVAFALLTPAARPPFQCRPRLVTPATRPPTARFPPIRAAANGTLTVGDALVGALNRQMEQLPEREHVLRAERTLDALVDSGTAELEALKHGLDRDLHRAGLNTSLQLQEGLRRTGAIYEAAFSHTEAALDAALVPTRDAVRAELQLHREEEAARREAARRRDANGRANGFARASTWRSLPHAPDRPKHAVVWVCEACSAILSLMLLFAVADLASAQHRVASPPRVARVHMRAPQRTFEYDEPNGLPLQTSRAADTPPTPAVAAVRSAAVRPAAVAAAQPAAPAPQRVENWWVMARGVFALWLASFGVICLRAGTDEWAALALGIEPCVDGGAAVGATGGAAGGGAACKAGGAGFVRWEYDWDRDAWREA